MTNEELLNRIQALKKINKENENKIKTLSGLLEVKLEAAGLDNFATDEASAFWQSQTKVEVKDWNKVMEYVHANKAYDILQKRISPVALKARVDAGASIEGVTVKEGAKTFIVKGKKENEEES